MDPQEGEQVFYLLCEDARNLLFASLELDGRAREEFTFSFHFARPWIYTLIVPLRIKSSKIIPKSSLLSASVCLYISVSVSKSQCLFSNADKRHQDNQYQSDWQ